MTRVLPKHPSWVGQSWAQSIARSRNPHIQWHLQSRVEAPSQEPMQHGIGRVPPRGKEEDQPRGHGRGQS